MQFIIFFWENSGGDFPIYNLN